MIVEQGKYYLYRHIRLDSNLPFYIGVGSKGNRVFYKHTNEYNRAYAKNNRNRYWKNIVKKVGYRVEILLESDDYKWIKEKEKEFVKLYGRVDKKEGILSNFTDGGEGTIRPNYKYRKTKALEVLIIDSKGVIVNSFKSHTEAANFYKVSGMSEYTKWGSLLFRKYRVINKKDFDINKDYKIYSKPSVLQYCALTGNFIKEWKSPYEAGKNLKISRSNINTTANKNKTIKSGFRRVTDYIFLWKNEEIPFKIDTTKPKGVKIKVLNVETGEIYESITKAAKYFNLDTVTLWQYLNNQLPNKTNLKLL